MKRKTSVEAHCKNCHFVGNLKKHKNSCLPRFEKCELCGEDIPLANIFYHINSREHKLKELYGTVNFNFLLI